ncbi:MAG: hypothetical protein WCF93_02570 [Candidatus Moraniibacteriota bacterium]
MKNTGNEWPNFADTLRDLFLESAHNLKALSSVKVVLVKEGVRIKIRGKLETRLIGGKFLIRNKKKGKYVYFSPDDIVTITLL